MRSMPYKAGYALKSRLCLLRKVGCAYIIGSMVEYITAKKALSASWLKTPILLSDMKAFAEHFSAYLSGAKTGETEEFH